MVLEGKGEEVASECARVTRAFCSRHGDKRRWGPGDDEADPLSSVTARRLRRRIFDNPKSVDGGTRVPAEEVEDNEEVEADDCVLGRRGSVRRIELQGVPLIELWTLNRCMEDLPLIPFGPFVRHVKEITENIQKKEKKEESADYSSEALRWKPEALLHLQAVSDPEVLWNMPYVAQPIPWSCSNTKLTLQQEEAVLALSCGTSGIPVYIKTITKANVTHRFMIFTPVYYQECLAPLLGSVEGKIQIFFGNNLTSTEVNFVVRNEPMLTSGWEKIVEDNDIKEGHIYAFTFEEEKEGGFLSARMHMLNGVLGSDYDQEQPQRAHGSGDDTLWSEHSVAVKRSVSMHIPYAPFYLLVKKIAGRYSRGYCWSRRKLRNLHKAAVEHLVSQYKLVNQFATHVGKLSLNERFICYTKLKCVLQETESIPDVVPEENSGAITYLAGCNCSEVITEFE